MAFKNLIQDILTNPIFTLQRLDLAHVIAKDTSEHKIQTEFFQFYQGGDRQLVGFWATSLSYH